MMMVVALLVQLKKRQKVGLLLSRPSWRMRNIVLPNKRNAKRTNHECRIQIRHL